MGARRLGLASIILRGAALAATAFALQSPAQQPSLEELQRQLDQARKEKAPAPKPRAEAETSARPAAPAVGKSMLVIESDAPCELRIDGQRRATLKARDAVVLTVDAGKQLVVCTSTEAESAEYRSVVETRSGAKEVLQISLASSVQEVQRKREAERAQAAAEAERKAKAEAAAAEQRAKQEAQIADCAAGRIKFIAVGNGVLRQCAGNLEWTQADNGSDIDWNGARNWCAARGAGWELPTVAELQGLYDGNATGRSCGRFTCKVAAPLQLTSLAFWSREADGPSRARLVVLVDGLASSNVVGRSVYIRALCVRRS